MFLSSYFFHHVGNQKSLVLAVLRFFQSFGISIVFVTLPLYLFDFFQSEFVVGQIETIGSFATIIFMLCFGYLLSRFHRSTLYKTAMCVGMIGLLFLIFLDSYFHAMLAGTGTKLISIIATSILALYVRDVVPPIKLLRFQSFITALSNSAFFVGPLFAGWLMHLLDSYEPFYNFLLRFGIFDPMYLKYQFPLSIAFCVYALVLGIFLWNKWYMRHIHLHDTKKESIHTNVHHPWHLRNIITYFHNPYRVLSFLNTSFITIWWVMVYIFFPLLLQRHGIETGKIALTMGLLVVPLIVGEFFVPQILRKFQGSFPALILGYTIFAFCLLIAFVFGYEHLNWFIFFLILSQCGVAITEPLQTYQFFEGTRKSEETKYYSLSLLGGVSMRFLTPVIFGFFVNMIGIDDAFKFIPFYLFLVVVVLIVYYHRSQKSEVRNQNVKN